MYVSFDTTVVIKQLSHQGLDVTQTLFCFHLLFYLVYFINVQENPVAHLLFFATNEAAGIISSPR